MGASKFYGRSPILDVDLKVGGIGCQFGGPVWSRTSGGCLLICRALSEGGRWLSNVPFSSRWGGWEGLASSPVGPKSLWASHRRTWLREKIDRGGSKG
jgi:hypothetical protein